VSTVAFPSLPGQTWPVIRTAIWQSRAQQSISGKILNIADWSQPKWQWEVTFSALRGYNATLLAAEIQNIQGFFNSRQGRFDSFLYSDTNDRSVTGSTIGTGDSTVRTFQLVRSLGGFSENILAPTTVTAVYVGSSSIASSKWSVAQWGVGGTTAPGIITFTTGNAPTTGQVVTADFTYAWPVSFNDDAMSFEEFVKKIWALKAVRWTSLK
jgi:uncharacterized protein (TIGR02217 family)